MDLYISSVLLGALGLAAMALSGLGGHGHAGHAGHASHGHSHGDVGHVGNGGHAVGHAHGAHGHAGPHGHHDSLLWAVMSPRFLFSVALGFGAVGELLRPVLSGPLQFVAAAAGGVLFERFLVSPLWNFAMSFASAPAITLDSAVSDEATAVTAFDGNGEGIVSLEVDGQIVQILATLQPDDRTLGARVRAGQRVRIENVNAAGSRCTVSLL